MSRIPTVLRYVAFAIMAAFGLLGGLFVIGETFADPGGWAAVWRSALWVVPLVALSVFALTRPAAAGAPLVGITVAVILFTLADSAFDIIPRDDWGPVAAVIVFALGVALAFLGLHRPSLAATLMLLTGLAQLAATVIGAWGADGAGAMLGGSSGVMILPIMVVGVLFLVSGLLEHQSEAPPRPQQPRLGATH